MTIIKTLLRKDYDIILLAIALLTMGITSLVFADNLAMTVSCLLWIALYGVILLAGWILNSQIGLRLALAHPQSPAIGWQYLLYFLYRCIFISALIMAVIAALVGFV